MPSEDLLFHPTVNSKHLMTGLRENKLTGFPRDQSLSDLLYSTTEIDTYHVEQDPFADKNKRQTKL